MSTGGNISRLLIGIGNEYRSDDGVGLYIADKLRSWNFPDINIAGCSGNGVDLMNLWEGYDDVILVDAVRSGAEPGTVFHFDAGEKQIPQELFGYSTHVFGVAQAIEMARTMRTLPSRLSIFGIEAENMEAGTVLSESIKNSSERAIKEIIQYINTLN
jgi:hydrogenase maturation protease